MGLTVYACDVLEDVGVSLPDTTSTSGEKPLTNDEVIAGLKEALTVGAGNSAGLASALDGFNKNARIRLPFPPEAQKVKEKALQLGMDEKVEKFELTLNRAAEEAAKEAKPIFVDAVKNMSIADGFAILKGSDTAATHYMRENTTSSLKSAFRPKVDNAIQTVELTKYWEPLATAYNKAVKFTGGDPINADLTEYVTNRATSGLFVLLKDEESKIRENPAARVTDILKRVFGSLDK